LTKYLSVMSTMSQLADEHHSPVWSSFDNLKCTIRTQPLTHDTMFLWQIVNDIYMYKWWMGISVVMGFNIWYTLVKLMYVSCITKPQKYTPSLSYFNHFTWTYRSCMCNISYCVLSRYSQHHPELSINKCILQSIIQWCSQEA